MGFLADSLETLWWEVGTHLWQTTIVLAVLLALDRVLRRAPARVRAGLWSVGLLKMFLPLSLLAPLVRPGLEWIEAAASQGSSDAVATVVVRVGMLMHPVSWVAAVPSEGSPWSGTGWIALTLIWIAGLAAVWMTGRRGSLALEIRQCRDLSSLAEGHRTKVLSASTGLGICGDKLLFSR